MLNNLDLWWATVRESVYAWRTILIIAMVLLYFAMRLTEKRRYRHHAIDERR